MLIIFIAFGNSGSDPDPEIKGCYLGPPGPEVPRFMSGAVMCNILITLRFCVEDYTSRIWRARVEKNGKSISCVSFFLILTAWVCLF